VPLLVALLGDTAAGPVIGAILVDLILTSTLCLALAQASLHRGSGDDARSMLAGALLSLRGALGNPLPWSIVIPAIAWKRRGSTAAVPPEDQELNVYLWLWALVPCAVFTLSGNILWTYVLPAIPAWAATTESSPITTLCAI